MWGAGQSLRGRANNSFITRRFREGGHVSVLSRSRNGCMSFLVVPERMPRCFTLYILLSLWKVPEKSMALLLLITKTEGVPILWLTRNLCESSSIYDKRGQMNRFKVVPLFFVFHRLLQILRNPGGATESWDVHAVYHEAGEIVGWQTLAQPHRESDDPVGVH